MPLRWKFFDGNILAVCLLVLLPVIGAGGESVDRVTEEVTFSSGVIEFNSGNFEAALDYFEPIAESNEAAAYYVAQCRSAIRKNNPVKLASTSGENSSPTIEELTSEDVPSYEFVNSNDDPVAIRESRPWHLTFLTAYEFDSNVTLSPQFTGLGSGTDIDDSRSIIAGFGDYQLVRQPDLNLGLVTSIFDSFHFHEEEFNAQDYMGGTYMNFAVSNIIAGVRYEYHGTLLGQRMFARDHRLVPNVSLLEGDFGHTTAFYEFDHTVFENAPLIPAMDRTGPTHGVGVTQAIYTAGGDGRIFVGGRYEDNRTLGTDFDRHTSMVTGRWEHPFWDGTIFDVEYRHFWDEYSNPNSLDFNDRPRTDRRSEVRAGFQRELSASLTLRLDYTYIDSNSNTQNMFGVRFFDYERHLFNTQLIVDF